MHDTVLHYFTDIFRSHAFLLLIKMGKAIGCSFIYLAYGSGYNFKFAFVTQEDNFVKIFDPNEITLIMQTCISGWP